ncbi:MAG TPA: M23 family metallopeptidase [Kofleriaceae bacterium]|nr:M23 family metallopeptidase [Kofleriaceae bacterium]
MVRGTGVAILCPPCAADPGGAGASAAAQNAHAERRARRPRRLLALAAAPVAAFLLSPLAFSRGPLGVAFGESAPSSPVLLSDDEIAADSHLAARIEVAPSEAPPTSALPIGFAGEALVEITWYHPLAGRRRLPGKADRRFGAPREASRPECGDGHCGVDIGNTVGEVIHAARPGRVARIVTEASRRGGRYVKLEHPGGYASYYFHLDRIHPELVPGIEVAAGEPLGTMGQSGIRFGRPHLHFAVARMQPDGSETFVDPEPMLRRAVLLDEPAPMPPPSREELAARVAEATEKAARAAEAAAQAAAGAPSVPVAAAAAAGEATWDPAADGTESPPERTPGSE